MSRKRNRDSRQQSVEDAFIDSTQDEGLSLAAHPSDSSRVRGLAAAKNYVDLHMTTDDIERKVKDLVRLAISHEYRRSALRRDDIKERVLGDHGKAFAVILDRAQITLKSVFGLELVEITKETKNQANRSWILRSTIDADLRTRNDVIDWSRDEALMGITSAILSLILVNGRVLSSKSLASYLRKLKMDDSFLTSRTHAPASNGAIPFDHPDSLNASNSTKLVADTQHILSYLVKHGYLEKTKSIEANASEAQENYDYKWGPRAKAEFPERDMVGFIGEIMGSDINTVEEDAESSRRHRSASKESESTPVPTTARTSLSLSEHIARAAGGPLEA